MFKIIKRSSVDWNTRQVTIEVYDEGYCALKQRLLEVFQKKHRKSMHNTIRLYLFLRVMNECKITHIAKEDLARMFFSKHTERLAIPLDYLVEANLLEVQGTFNDASNHYYYTYMTKGLDLKVNDKMKVRAFEMDIPEHVMFYLRLPQGQSPVQKLQMNSGSDECDAKREHEPRIVQDSFILQFTGWYDELLFAGKNTVPGHFSPADGRFYHFFHYCPVEYRKASVTWDGEHLVEYWDASSAFFIVLCYVLREHVDYSDDNLKDAIMDETEKMLNLALSGNLYQDIQNYHNDRTNYPVERSTIKEWCQTYKGVDYKYLFNKDGTRSKTYYAKRLWYIDEYFEKYFPNIRHYILSYPRIESGNKNLVEWIMVNGKLVCKRQPKFISGIHKAFMPYEFKLISVGLCKRIYKKYGIKCLTVHDAIYMKKSDADKGCVDVNRLLEIELGLRSPDSVPLW